MSEIIDLVCEFWILGFLAVIAFSMVVCFILLKKELDKTYPEDIDFGAEEDKDE